jgi:glycosyltransferase involved in cell wall biosynthesis
LTATDGPFVSVVIPAHDEAAVIERCLRTLLEGTAPGDIEVVVVANGCTDDTVEIVHRVAPEATVLDLDVASKVAALNAGDLKASAYPRAYLDADVEVSAASLRAVAAALEAGGARCGAPEMRLELEGRPWYVRRFFAAFQALPYLADDLVGNGLYVLSEQGRGCFDDFPDITADDLFVRNLFSDDERITVTDATFRVHPPRNLSGLLAIRERAYRGNDEYRDLGFTSHAGRTRDRRRLLAVARARPLDMAVFASVNLAARLRLRFRRRPIRWERDDSGRN